MTYSHTGYLGRPYGRPALSAAALQRSSVPFYLAIFYLALEFGRIQEIVPALTVLHLPAIATVALATALLLSRRTSLADKQTKSFGLLLGLMAFHIPIAVNNYFALHIAQGMFQTFLVYLAIIAFVDSFALFRRLINIWLGIHVYLAIAGLLMGGRGVGGFLGDENEFAMALNMAIPFAFFLAFVETTTTRRLACAALAGLFVVASMRSFSRAGFLGLVAVGAYCWLRSPRKIVSAALLAVLILFAVQVVSEEYWAEIETIRRGSSDPTGEDRIYEWKIGWRMFVDNPLIGVGQGNFPFVFRDYEVAAGLEEGLNGKSRAGRAAHSLYLTVLPELGLMGTLVWSFMLYRLFADTRLARKSARKPADQVSHLARAIDASLIAYLVGGVFNSVFYYPNFWVLMGFALALRKTAEYHEDHSPSN